MATSDDKDGKGSSLLKVDHGGGVAYLPLSYAPETEWNSHLSKLFLCIQQIANFFKCMAERQR